MRAEIDDWLEAIFAKTQPRLSGKSTLLAMRLIDECYKSRKQLVEPWVSHPLCNANGQPNVVSPQRVLITGATGFIGCRVAEVLSNRAGYAVRALVHKPGNASRLARLPVEMIQADLRDKAAIEAALAGCDAVVHCAIGTTYGDHKQIRAVTVGGTENLLAAVQANKKIRRFVHLSSLSVYGDEVRGTIDESIKPSPSKNDKYGRTKFAAEQLVIAAARQGLSSIVLRPGCVYGPFGATFTSRPLSYLKNGRLVLQNDLAALCAPTGRIVVDTPDADQVAALLDGQVEHRDGQQLLVRYSDAAALNTRLVGAGLRVSSIGPQQRTLEDIVLSVTGAGSDQIS
jgi:nucleoside-diphosphate-sugar epimerase